ncbi:MAG: BCD family MFS transporter [Rhizobiaceae bacterium]|nr:BCD family MFS transporter [Rhizobiaceae bacterium]
MTSVTSEIKYFSWVSIIRLGLVQTALGAIVVLTTSTLNRIMVVEYALPAILPGALVGLHYAIQMTRPRWGYGADVGGRRTPWIVGGMMVLAIGGFLAALGTALMADQFAVGLCVTILAFLLIGLGVGAAGTSLLTLLAVRVAPNRRPAAASIVWIMMIAGFVVTAIAAGSQLDPYTPTRLVAVSASVSIVALLVATCSVWGIEGKPLPNSVDVSGGKANKPDFKKVFLEVWAEKKARQFTIFVFVSMLAYSAQDLILEPFAGLVFGMTPGESTKLTGVQNGGVMLGMIMVAVVGSAIGGKRLGSMRFWAVGGCLASAFAFVGLAISGNFSDVWPLRANVFFLGLSNGAFAVAAIGSMMGLASDGGQSREGTRMGLWGASQAIAFGLGGFLGTVAVDVARAILGESSIAYGSVFGCAALLFAVSAALAWQVAPPAELKAERETSPETATGDISLQPAE